MTKGLEQLEGYLNRINPAEGWLVIFDRRESALELEERLEEVKAQTSSGQTVTVIRA